MADVIEMIQLSPTMEEGVLVKWLKKEGDTVAAGDLIAEVETDKATMEMESFFDGVLLKLLVEVGSAVPIGTPMAVVGEAGEDVDEVLASLKSRSDAKKAGASEAEGGAEAGAAGADTDEAEGDETDTEEAKGDKAGTEKARGDKAAAENAEGTATKDAGSGGGPTVSKRTSAPSSGAAARVTRSGRVFASPLARRLAEERGYDIAGIPGSGPGGRVVRRDVDAYVPAPSAGGRAALLPFVAPEERVEPLSQMRKAIARNLAAAWQAPVFMLTRDIAMDRVVDVRSELNAALAERETGTKLSINDFVIKACALALIDVPAMNSAFEGDAVRLFGAADIGFAVALDGGLITPIIRSAEAKSVAEIADEAKDLAARARSKKLKPEEFTGASFSVSNLGMYGIDHFTAVLNPPAAGILAVGATRKVPVVGPDDALTVGQRMSVTLTCDHRAVDGAVGATFLQRFAHYLERPSLLLVS